MHIPGNGGMKGPKKWEWEGWEVGLWRRCSLTRWARQTRSTRNSTLRQIQPKNISFLENLCPGRLIKTNKKTFTLTHNTLKQPTEINLQWEYHYEIWIYIFKQFFITVRMKRRIRQIKFPPVWPVWLIERSGQRS